MKNYRQLDMATSEKMLVSELRRRLILLRNNHFVTALKTGTEIEDMSFPEIRFMREISRTVAGDVALPLVVKIGGPEARRDIRDCLKTGVDTILAPMVETVYALTNFVDAAESLQKDEKASNVHLAFNLETITAVTNLDLMIESTSFQKLNQVTIGRGDLSKSMHMKVDDPEVMRVTVNSLRKINSRGKVTSVGGGLTIANISEMSEKLPSTRFNTRHVVLENTSFFRKDSKRHLCAALEFELELYRALGIVFPERKAYYQERSEVLAVRLEREKVSGDSFKETRKEKSA